MAPSFTGILVADHARSMELCHTALHFATLVLRPGSSFICKFLAGGTEHELKKVLQSRFHAVKYEKPEASAKRSTEGFFVCSGFKSRDGDRNSGATDTSDEYMSRLASG